MAGSSDKKKRERPAKKVTAGYLERAALHYLGRFSSSEANLRAVLVRKVRRRSEGHAPPTDEQLGWIDDVVAKCARYGYVNDASYAQQRAELLLRRGKPLRLVRQDLRHKGIDSETIEALLSSLSAQDGADPDRQAAAAYVRRRRFGAFSREPLDDGRRQKQLAAMARAGFGFELARETLTMSMDEVTALLA